MARLTTEQRLERAKQAKAKAEAEIRSAAAKLREADRREDTRRKILIGGAFIGRAMKNEKYASVLRNMISQMPDRDRSLFDTWFSENFSGTSDVGSPQR